MEIIDSFDKRSSAEVLNHLAFLKVSKLQGSIVGGADDPLLISQKLKRIDL